MAFGWSTARAILVSLFSVSVRCVCLNAIKAKFNILIENCHLSICLALLSLSLPLSYLCWPVLFFFQYFTGFFLFLMELFIGALPFPVLFVVFFLFEKVWRQKKFKFPCPFPRPSDFVGALCCVLSAEFCPAICFFDQLLLTVVYQWLFIVIFPAILVLFCFVIGWILYNVIRDPVFIQLRRTLGKYLI